MAQQDVIDVTGAERPYAVRLFGAFAVDSVADGRVTPKGRKARALLAYLVLAGEAVSRDRLAGLFWSERGDEQARASLRQTLYEMRALAAGERPVVMFDRAQAWVVQDAVGSDLARMQQLAVTGDAAGLAVAVGDQPRQLLADLDGIDPAFDEWLTLERTRRGDERRRIILAVGDRALAAGDADAALRLGTCLLAIDPIDEAGARLAMAAYHRGGDRDGIRQVYSRLEAALRSEVGVGPAEETVASYRSLAAAPPRLPLQAAADASAVSDASRVGERADIADIELSDIGPADPRMRWHWRTVSLIILAVAGGCLWWTQSGTGAGQRVLLVEPLRVAADDRSALALKDGLSTDLARMMVGNGNLLNVADQRDEPANGGRAGGGGVRSANFAVTGDAASSGGVLYANVNVVDDHATILWSSSFSRPIAEVDGLREQIASKVADVTLCALGSRDFGALDLETTRLFLGACEQKHGDWAVSVKLLRQAVARQPGFAHGWAMLSAATASIADESDGGAAVALRKQANAYARRALSLNRNEPEAYYALAEILPGIANWRRRMAILAAGHAVDPTNSVINSTISGNLAKVGRIAEAISYARTAVEFDPFNPRELAWLVELLADSGQLDAATATLRQAQPRFSMNRHLLRTEFIISALAGDPRRAKALLLATSPDADLQLTNAAIWTKFVAARIDPTPARVDQAVRDTVADATAPRSHGLSAVVRLVALHHIAEAWILLDQFDTRYLDDLDTESLFSATMAPMRADPRFIALTERLKLMPIWVENDRWPDFCSEESLRYNCRVEAKKALSNSKLVQ